jgi:membrane protease subunit (stomatin/prohibitin family)
MGLFGQKKEGGLADVIRCDEKDYLIWKWRPTLSKGASKKENALRWGSSLRVKDGEVAVFVYKKSAGGEIQEFIEGPFDETLKTANFPILSSLIGAAFDGKSPFQAEVYFINLAGIIPVKFRVPYFDVFDPRFLDFPVPMAVGGMLSFNITDYRAFIKLHRMIDFDLAEFTQQIREAMNKYVKGAVSNIPGAHGIPVLQIERKVLEINELIQPQLKKALEEDYGVNLKRLDISAIDVDKESEGFEELRLITADQQKAIIGQQTQSTIDNIATMQDNMAKTLEIQRRNALLQAEQANLAAFQVEKQSEVLKEAATSLGKMGNIPHTGGGGQEHTGGGSSFNPISVMTGLALGGAMGGQMANMVGQMGQNIQSSPVPPPLPQIAYNIAVDGQSSGPYPLLQLQQMALQGQLTRETYVWKQGMSDWTLAGDVAELAPLFAPTPPPAPPSKKG